MAKPDHNVRLEILLAERWFVSDQHFDGNGEVRDNLVEYGYFETLAEIEYELSRRFSAFFHFPFLNHTYTVTPLSLQKNGVWKTGDPEIGMFYNFSPERAVTFRAGLFLGIPLGYHGKGALVTGDGEFNQLIKLEAGNGRRIVDEGLWWMVYTGFNHRTRGYAEEIRFGGLGGVQVIRDKLAFSVRIDGVKALGNGAGSDNINPQSLFSNYRELVSISPLIGFQVHSSVQVSIDTGIPVSGQNIFRNPSFGISVLWQKKIWQ